MCDSVYFYISTVLLLATMLVFPRPQPMMRYQRRRENPIRRPVVRPSSKGKPRKNQYVPDQSRFSQIVDGCDVNFPPKSQAFAQTRQDTLGEHPRPRGIDNIAHRRRRQLCHRRCAYRHPAGLQIAHDIRHDGPQMRRPRSGKDRPRGELTHNVLAPTDVEFPADYETRVGAEGVGDPVLDGRVAGDVQVEVDAAFGEEEQVAKEVGFENRDGKVKVCLHDCCIVGEYPRDPFVGEGVCHEFDVCVWIKVGAALGPGACVVGQAAWSEFVPYLARDFQFFG